LLYIVVAVKYIATKNHPQGGSFYIYVRQTAITRLSFFIPKIKNKGVFEKMKTLTNSKSRIVALFLVLLTVVPLLLGFVSDSENYTIFDVTNDNENTVAPTYISIDPASNVSVQMHRTGSFTAFPSAWHWAGSMSYTEGFSVTVNGVTVSAACVQPRIPAPPAGTFSATILAPGSSMSNAIYYVFGPGSSQLFTSERMANMPSGLSFDVLAHLILSDIYGSPASGLNPIGQAAISEFTSAISSLPTPQIENSGAMSFSSSSLTATRQGHVQMTEWTTFTGVGSEVTIFAPPRASIHLNHNGVITSSTSSVTVRHGDQIRFSTNNITNPPLPWSSGDLHDANGASGRQWRAMTINSAASTQTIAFGGEIEIGGVVAPVSLSVQWDAAHTFPPNETHLTKVWNDGNNPARPTSVQVQLFRDGVAYGAPVTLNAANNWSHVFLSLDSQ
jgi:hypothetical protein